MDLQKAKILLEKIASLHKNISADANNISAIERDLMLTYVKQLYEAYLTESLTPPQPTPAPEPKVEIIKSAPKPKPKPQKKAEIKKEPPALEVPQIEEESKEVVVKTTSTPREIQLPDSLKEVVDPTPSPKPKPKPTPAPKPQAKAAPPKVDDNEVEALFDLPAAKELSDKLSSLPIKDLRKAMGLNEKIFTINELFGGDQAAYDAAIATLNSLSNFEQAKSYLVDNVAGTYNWVSRNKKKKATNFIKLIRRRYN